MSDRAERYAEQLDAKLDDIDGDRGRLWFLRTELGKWEQRKARFEIAINRDDFDPCDVTIWDFALTIAEINVRLGRVESAMAKAALQATGTAIEVVS
jgi:hypothetical protein